MTLRVIKSKHDTRTKKRGVTFYNEEAQAYLQRYLASGGEGNNIDFVYL